MNKELIFEIGCEEIPSNVLSLLIKQLVENSIEIFKKEDLPFKEIKAFGTPRRLTLQVKELAKNTRSTLQKIIGPDIKVAFDNEGKPTKAAIGFARSQNINLDKLKIVETKKGKKIAIFKEVPGKDTKAILPEILIQILNSLTPPKTMRWELNLKFIRPIRWIFCIWGKDLIKFSFGGITSNNFTYGHRLTGNKKIELKKAEDYFSLLRKNYVILDQEERRKMILEELRRHALKLKAELIEDEELLETVTNLVEYPVIYLGKFEEKFLKLPSEILITSLKEHQKCFSLKDKKEKLLPYFLLVSNCYFSKAKENIIQGNQRVVKARLNDAFFFFKEDQKIRLEERVEKEKGVIWHEQLGTLWDKTKMLISLSKFIAEKQAPDKMEEVKRAAFLSKADLDTEMVKEFPNLQGIVGYYYALSDKEKKEVALAIKEHYLPRFLGDRLPQTITGSILSVSDRLINISGFFSKEFSYSGSADPYALRRQAQGIISILLHQRFNLSLEEMIDESLRLWKNEDNNLRLKILEFLEERIRFILSQCGINPDIIEAIRKKFTLPYEAFNIGKIIKEYKEREDFQKISISLKRVYNIVGKNSYEKEIRKDLFREEEEKDLYNIYKEIEENTRKKFKEDDYIGVIDEFKKFIHFINRFFDKVMVMVEDREIRENRLTLLYQIKKLSLKFIDFSAILI